VLTSARKSRGILSWENAGMVEQARCSLVETWHNPCGGTCATPVATAPKRAASSNMAEAIGAMARRSAVLINHQERGGNNWFDFG
jgi:hypothetical protein